MGGGFTLSGHFSRASRKSCLFSGKRDDTIHGSSGFWAGVRGYLLGLYRKRSRRERCSRGSDQSCPILWREASKAQCNIRYVHLKIGLPFRDE
ncbi:hypothetical protein CSPAE12_02857 [Colletotrichum incanum]|nr:hypothetical protein CSPAE12_02857 [Colletotrichum incanum]